MTEQDIIPHLFRTEFSRITIALCRYFGMSRLDLAEDIASETFLSALETWPYQGIPRNPAAWLNAVAKNKALNQCKREQLFSGKVLPEISRSNIDLPETDMEWPGSSIRDGQLQMLFAICHPCIPADAQIGLALRILCGFGITEIANAFLTNAETIRKRLYRAREKLRTGKVEMMMPPEAEIPVRLQSVITTLYLLYNEGYYSESHNEIVREDFCAESMRLTCMLIENPSTDFREVNALFALMCFHSSRFPARKDEQGRIVLYAEQDPSKWNTGLIARGVYHLHRSARGETLSKYHLEATIAWWHTQKEDTIEKWENILKLYDELLQVHYSEIAALNRIFALSKVKGKHQAITDAEKLQLPGNPYYFTMMGDLYLGIDNEKSASHYATALSLAGTPAEHRIISEKLGQLAG